MRASVPMQSCAPVCRFTLSYVCTMLLFLVFCARMAAADTQANPPDQTGHEEPAVSKRASAIFAGGCFWCMETDFEHAPGVVEVISGYSGGRTRAPTYETYAAGGHREVVFIVFDPSQITYRGLVEYLIKHIDPLNRHGQFSDKGLQYSPAIYYANEQEKRDAQEVLDELDALRIFRGKIGVALEAREAFWPAEDYHQNFHRRNPLKYQMYRNASGRDAFTFKHWGPRLQRLELPGAIPTAEAADSASKTDVGEPNGGATDAEELSSDAQPWRKFRKPSLAQLRRQLTPMQFKVTQQDGTEPAFRNEYWNHKERGIYVDVVSGAPLFSSLAKYDSGTGWPSFVVTIDPDAVVYHRDLRSSMPRIEVRSRYGDSHLGHVFDDGPVALGGKRYCMNSAALRFIPVADMESAGYGEYLRLFELPR